MLLPLQHSELHPLGLVSVVVTFHAIISEHYRQFVNCPVPPTTQTRTRAYDSAFAAFHHHDAIVACYHHDTACDAFCQQQRLLSRYDTLPLPPSPLNRHTSRRLRPSPGATDRAFIKRASARRTSYNVPSVHCLRVTLSPSTLCRISGWLPDLCGGHPYAAD